MPAKSKAQKRLMQQALAYKRKKIKKVSKRIKKLSSELTINQLKDFIKGNPDKEYVNESFLNWIKNKES